MNTCSACPFNYGSEESERVQNYGCLFSPGEIIDQHIASGKTWACHETRKTCRGFALEVKTYDPKAGLFFEVGSHAKVIDYSLNTNYERSTSIKIS